MSYLRGFIPWIAFAVISTIGWQWGALAGLLIGLQLLIKDRRSGVAADALILETSTLAYFAALTAFAFAAPHSPVEHYVGALSFAWLAATAWSTLAVRRPFTLGIARRSTPRELWNTPQFLRINTVITTVWATCFALTAAAIAACDATHTGALATTACQVVGFLAPAAFTNRYRAIAQARLAAGGSTR
ncbi:hypothetical protein ABZ746_09065 [Streptomyces sp. NPDC020096]